MTTTEAPAPLGMDRVAGVTQPRWPAFVDYRGGCTYAAQLVTVSKTAVNRAGSLICDAIFQGGGEPEALEVARAINAITEFRTSHARPLQRVAAGLRYYVDKHTVGRPIVVGQRLKRLPTMIDKLRREPGMNLARMHDIGGCRAVVATEDELRAIAAHLQRRWARPGARVVRQYDYVERPKQDTGYRAIHLVIERDGRLIEVQLRTKAQHAWAELIESVDRRNPSLGLKGGEAPADLTEYYRLGADLLAMSERGEQADRDTLLRFQALHEKVGAYTTPNPPPNGP
jgi:putative GTP pyrophosphokinase